MTINKKDTQSYQNLFDIQSKSSTNAIDITPKKIYNHILFVKKSLYKKYKFFYIIDIDNFYISTDHRRQHIYIHKRTNVNTNLIQI